jgi:ketosteroid isomerase-like protein
MRILQPVSVENVELVRRVYDGWAVGDFGAAYELLAPDFEWRQASNAVEPGTHRGAAIGSSLRKVFEVDRDFRIEAEAYIDAGDQVMVVARSRGTARQSGLKLNQMFFYVWTVEDGRLVRNQVYGERSEALRAAGLST